MTDGMENLQDWVGNVRSAEGRIEAWPADALNATLDRDDAPLQDGDAIPPGWHQIYLHRVAKLGETAPDGHTKRGDFLPPVPLPRRMWAGTRSTYHRPLHVGEKVSWVSTIGAVTPKEGRTGRLVFLRVDHEISGEDGVATSEVQDVVYREAAKPGAPAPAPRPAPAEAVWRRDIHPTPVLLFRFSALTMNSHRIHYDRTYVTETEGYPGLLVHGPLTAVLLLDLFRREKPQATMTGSDIRAMSPLYDIHDFSVGGAPGDDGASASLWALNHEGALAMTADVTFEG